MLPEIDFLPASYRQNQLNRRRQTWRVGVLGVFVGLAVLGTFAQHRIRGRLERSRAELLSHAEHMTSQLESADALYDKVRNLDAKANLMTRLQVHPATTRVLADVTSTLPQFVSLTEFRVNVETASPKAEEKGRGKSAQQVAANSSPYSIDLTRLNDVDSRSTQVVALHGIAPDDGAVAKYLAALEHTGRFDQVRLLFTEGYKIRGYELRSFGIRLHVRKPKIGIPQSEILERTARRSS